MNKYINMLYVLSKEINNDLIDTYSYYTEYDVNFELIVKLGYTFITMTLFLLGIYYIILDHKWKLRKKLD